MINKAKFLVFILAVFLIAGGAYAAIPDAGGPKGGDKIQRHNPLNLTPDQQTKLKELRDNFRKDTVFLRNDIKVKRLELRALWTVPQPEKDKIMAKQKELMDLVTQLQTKAVDYRLEARSSLTPEQAAQAGMLWGQIMGHRGHRNGRMKGEF